MKQNIKIAKELIKLAKSLVALTVRYVGDIHKNDNPLDRQLYFYDEKCGKNGKKKRIYIINKNGRIQWVYANSTEYQEPKNQSANEKNIRRILSLPRIESFYKEKNGLYNVPEQIIDQRECKYQLEDFYDYSNKPYVENDIIKEDRIQLHAKKDHPNRRRIKEIIKNNSNIEEKIQFIGYDVEGEWNTDGTKRIYVIYNTTWCYVCNPVDGAVVTGYFVDEKQRDGYLKLPKFIKFIPYNQELGDSFIICQQKHNTTLSSTFDKMFKFIDDNDLNNRDRVDAMTKEDLVQLEDGFYEFWNGKPKKKNNTQKASSKFNKKIFIAKKLIKLAKTLIY